MEIFKIVIFVILITSVNSFAPINETPINISSNLERQEWVSMTDQLQEQAPSSVIKSHHGIKLIDWKFEKVKPYLLFSGFLLLAAFVKIIYHHLAVIHAYIPESCVLIILGSIIGLLFHSTDYGGNLQFKNNQFFFLLLPPIILESSYSLHNRQFFFNLKTILLYAIIGTLLNIILIGVSLYTVAIFGFMEKIPILELLTFSTIISAVDPVAVLAIFTEIGVNKSLYFLVFGESLLNDAVVITIYNVLTSITSAGEVTVTDIALGIVSFFTVSLGGAGIGIICGIVTALITRTTKHVQVVEPLVVIVIAYLSYIISELFHFSGIIGLIACGVVQYEYIADNIASHSLVTIKYFTKTCSSIADVIIFFYLGRVLVRDDHYWDYRFVTFATLFCIIYRFFSVFLLTLIANKFMQSIRRINFGEQLLMAYGGLRGAIAFSLVISLDSSSVTNYQLFITTTLFIILFTVFILGSTTKPVIKWLNVKLATRADDEDKAKLLFIEITDRTLDTIMSGIEEISDCSSVHTFAQKFSRFNQSILKRLLTSHSDTGHSLTRAYKKVQDQVIRRSIDDGNFNEQIEIDPYKNGIPKVTPSDGNDSEAVTDYEEMEGARADPEKRKRRKVLKKAATLGSTYKHKYQPRAQTRPGIILHSQSTVERRVYQQEISIDEEFVRAPFHSRRRSSQNRRIAATLFNASHYYHLPRRDALPETMAHQVELVIRQTSRPRGQSISDGQSINGRNFRHSRRRNRPESETGSPPNTPTSLVSNETHL